MIDRKLLTTAGLFSLSLLNMDCVEGDEGVIIEDEKRNVCEVKWKLFFHAYLIVICKLLCMVIVGISKKISFQEYILESHRMYTFKCTFFMTKKFSKFQLVQWLKSKLKIINHVEGTLSVLFMAEATMEFTQTLLIALKDGDGE